MDLAMESPFNFLMLLKGNKITKEDFLQTRIWEQEDKKEFFEEVLKEAGQVLFWLSKEDLDKWKFDNLQTAGDVQYSNGIELFSSYKELVDYAISGKANIFKIREIFSFCQNRNGSLRATYEVLQSIKLLNYVQSLNFERTEQEALNYNSQFIVENQQATQKAIINQIIYEYHECPEFINEILQGRVNLTLADFVFTIQDVLSYPQEKVASQIWYAFSRGKYDMQEVTTAIKFIVAGWENNEFETRWDSLNLEQKQSNQGGALSDVLNPGQSIPTRLIRMCGSREPKKFRDVLQLVMFDSSLTEEKFLDNVAGYLATMQDYYHLTEEHHAVIAYMIQKAYPEMPFAKKMAMFLATPNQRHISMDWSAMACAVKTFRENSEKGEISIEEFKDILTALWAMPAFNESRLQFLQALTDIVHESIKPCVYVDMFKHLKQIWPNKIDRVIIDLMGTVFGREFYIKFPDQNTYTSQPFWVTMPNFIQDFVVKYDDKYCDKAEILNYLEKIPACYKERITARHKEVDAENGFKVNPLTALQAIAYEYEFIRHAILTFDTPDKCHEVVSEKVNAIRGGFDSFNIVGNRAALQYFVSKRAENNAFVAPKKVKREVFMLEMNKEGVPGLEQVNPFERGFSWANFEAMCALAEINPYGRKNAAKRFACYLLTAVYRDEPGLLSGKFKEAGFEYGIKSAVDAIAQIIPHSSLISGNPPILLKKVFENRDVWCEYWSNKHEHIKLIAAFYTVYVNSGKLLSPNVLTQMAQVAQTFKEQGLERYLDEVFAHIDEVNITLKNGTTLSTITTALDFVRNNDAPEEKTIKLDEVVVPAEEVSARILKHGDIRALTIGEEVSCCQHIRGHARTCAEETYTNPDYCVMIVEDTSKSEPTVPVAESALWISDDTVVIDSIESRRSDASAVNKVGQAFEIAIKQWFAQGLKVVISTTSYGMTAQVRAWLRDRFEMRETESPEKPSDVYSDVGHYVHSIEEK